MYLTTVVFFDTQTGWTAGGDNDLVLISHTSNGGMTWREQDIGNTQYLGYVFFSNAGQGWATGWTGTIIHTETGGE